MTFTSFQSSLKQPEQNRGSISYSSAIPMSVTHQRDEVCTLAKTAPKKAHELAIKIEDSWYRTQALSWVVRFTDSAPRTIANLAIKAASECNDAYQRSAVQSWLVAALAERGDRSEAHKILRSAVALACTVQPVSSRSEALFLLFQAAFLIGTDEATAVYAQLEAVCPPDHWRSKRALRRAKEILSGEHSPRVFFW